ncbi:MAG: hypothetical protein IJ685_04280 [Selenomonadaceae bacterium]|nr:hypothetical protein [Selenomonadaceae bacterium]
MTEQEIINQNIQRQIDAQNARIDNVLTKVDMLISESQQQREDIRRAQEKHDADIKEMNQRFYAKFDAMDAKVDANFKEFAKQLHSNFVQTMIGVGAIMAAIGGLLIAALK